MTRRLDQTVRGGMEDGGASAVPPYSRKKVAAVSRALLAAAVADIRPSPDFVVEVSAESVRAEEEEYRKIVGAKIKERLRRDRAAVGEGVGLAATEEESEIRESCLSEAKDRNGSIEQWKVFFEGFKKSALEKVGSKDSYEEKQKEATSQITSIKKQIIGQINRMNACVAEIEISLANLTAKSAEFEGVEFGDHVNELVRLRRLRPIKKEECETRRELIVGRSVLEIMWLAAKEVSKQAETQITKKAVENESAETRELVMAELRKTMADRLEKNPKFDEENRVNRDEEIKFLIHAQAVLEYVKAQTSWAEKNNPHEWNAASAKIAAERIAVVAPPAVPSSHAKPDTETKPLHPRVAALRGGRW